MCTASVMQADYRCRDGDMPLMPELPMCCSACRFEIYACLLLRADAANAAGAAAGISMEMELPGAEEGKVWWLPYSSV
jgi:hypothetical protein